MKSKRRFHSAEIRASQIKDIVNQYYEPGRQDRCKAWVYRTYIRRQFGISERTFYRILGEQHKTIENNSAIQLSLFDYIENK